MKIKAICLWLLLLGAPLQAYATITSDSAVVANAKAYILYMSSRYEVLKVKDCGSFRSDLFKDSLTMLYAKDIYKTKAYLRGISPCQQLLFLEHCLSMIHKKNNVPSYYVDLYDENRLYYDEEAFLQTGLINSEVLTNEEIPFNPEILTREGCDIIIVGTNYSYSQAILDIKAWRTTLGNCIAK